MKIGIVGARAVGGYYGAALARAGEDARLIARGETLHALTAHGLTAVRNDETCSIPRVFATRILRVVIARYVEHPQTFAPDLAVCSAVAGMLSTLRHRPAPGRAEPTRCHSPRKASAKDWDKQPDTS